MQVKQDLIKTIEVLSPSVIEELFRYALYLQQAKPSTASDLTLASEHAFAKEWLLPEEEVAWEHL